MSQHFSRGTRRLGVSVVVGLLALTGCSSAVGEREAAAGAASEPQEGGTLRLGIATDLLPTSVFSNASDGTNTVIGLVYDTLIDYGTDSLEPQPSLATSWEQSEDGRELTLQLRDDVTFHSGREFTSDDVEFSIKNTFADPAWAVQLQRTAAAITSYDTSDPHAITLRSKQPLSNIFDLLDMVPIVDSESFDQLRDGSEYVGTGAFTFESWKPGASMSFARNDDYWDGAPNLEGVEVSVITDANAQVTQLRSGQLDAVIGGSFRDLKSLEEAGGHEVQPYQGAENQYYVGSNVEHPALKDVKLRQAIAFAVDRDRIVADVLRGIGYPTVLPWPEYSPAYDEEANATYDRDVEKAKELASGVGNIAPIPLQYQATNPNSEAIAQIVQSNLEEIGVPTELRPTEHAEFINQLIGAEFEGLWITNHSYAQYNPATLVVSAYPFNADKNASRFSDAAYTEHANASWEVADPQSAEATEIYDDLNQDLLDNVFLTELAITYQVFTSSTALQDVAWSKRSELDLSDAYLAQ
jgi:peptide/nickel transport system substrate-binding protein